MVCSWHCFSPIHSLDLVVHTIHITKPKTARSSLNKRPWTPSRDETDCAEFARGRRQQPCRTPTNAQNHQDKEVAMLNDLRLQLVAWDHGFRAYRFVAITHPLIESIQPKALCIGPRESGRCPRGSKYDQNIGNDDSATEIAKTAASTSGTHPASRSHRWPTKAGGRLVQEVRSPPHRTFFDRETERLNQSFHMKIMLNICWIHIHVLASLSLTTPQSIPSPAKKKTSGCDSTRLTLLHKYQYAKLTFLDAI